MTTLTKEKSHAFGKDCFLLGRDKHGDLIWLEAAQWDCSWYWGFGYVEVYTRQTDPANSRDISSHSHFDGLVKNKDGEEYKHHINQFLKNTVLTDSESWELSDLMKSFYTLREAAAVLGRGNSHLTGTKNSKEVISLESVKHINEVSIPAIFKRAYEILTPSKDA